MDSDGAITILIAYDRRLLGGGKSVMHTLRLPMTTLPVSQALSLEYTMTLTLLLALLCASPLPFQEKPSDDLAKIQAELKVKPDDPTLHAKKCKALFAAGKEQEAVDYGPKAMAKFKAAKNKQASIQLGEIKSKSKRIEVHFNMGPNERADKPDLIVRPLSFKILSDGEKPTVSQVLDFELGYINGKALTAAIGITTDEGHGNYGILDCEWRLKTAAPGGSFLAP